MPILEVLFLLNDSHKTGILMYLTINYIYLISILMLESFLIGLIFLSDLCAFFLRNGIFYVYSIRVYSTNLKFKTVLIPFLTISKLL